tara:strand:+ start:618 stop:1040 length:423 start_codon:yes stop_codon:yes gene_type:complete
VLNLNAINYEFPGDSFIIAKKTNELVSLSTGKQTSINIDNNESHQIFSLIAMSHSGISLDELFKLLDFDVSKGPMLGQCDVSFNSKIMLNQKYDVKGRIISIDHKKSKKIGDIDIVKFVVEIILKKEKIVGAEYTLILPC